MHAGQQGAGNSMKTLPEVWNWSMSRKPWYGIIGHNTACNSCAGLGLHSLVLMVERHGWLACFGWLSCGLPLLAAAACEPVFDSVWTDWLRVLTVLCEPGLAAVILTVVCRRMNLVNLHSSAALPQAPCQLVTERFMAWFLSRRDRASELAGIKLRLCS